MRYNSIKDFDIKQGDGINVSLWTQGCPHRCEGCHNEETWEMNGGKEFTDQTIEDIISMLNEKDVNKNLSILGGEPMMNRNLKMLSKLVTEVKKRTNASIWIWTGYTIEEILPDYFNTDMLNILYNIDYLVDGKFEKDKKINSRYMGSSNQRVIDMNLSWLFGKVVTLN